jgi:CRP/FNR family transcriptional regulator
MLEEACIGYIQKSDFLKEINTNEKLRNTVIRVLSKELQDRADLLTTMAQKTVRQRTALALILLDDIYKGAPINLSRDDLANFVGTATETVIRLLREFKKDAVIETKGRKITIIEKDHLMSISEII